MTKYILLFIPLVALFSCAKLDGDKPGNLVPPTVADDPSLPAIEINGAQFHAETLGDINNPILIFLHGGPGIDYRPFISQIGEENASRYPNERTVTDGGLSQLQDEYFCVFYDQRGAGLSQRFEKGEIDFDTYVADLHSIINYYKLQKLQQTGISDDSVYLFAWSFGGILATGYINEYPESVKDVIFYEPGPFAKNVVDYFRENTTSVFGQVGEEWLEDYLLAHDHVTSDSHERADYQMLLGAFKGQPEFHQNENCPLWRVGSIVSNENLDFFNSNSYDITSNLSNFTGRALFIGGERTIADLPEYLNLQQAYYPTTEIITVPNIGHTGVWEKPTEISQIVRNFLP